MNWPQPQPQRKRKPSKPAANFTFNIPFIDDKFYKHTKTTTKQKQIPARLTNRRDVTIRELTKITSAIKPNNGYRSKTCQAPGVCQRSFVVYKATYNIWPKLHLNDDTQAAWQRPRAHHCGKKSFPVITIWRTLFCFPSKRHPINWFRLRFTTTKHPPTSHRRSVRNTNATTLRCRQEHLGNGFLIWVTTLLL